MEKRVFGMQKLFTNPLPFNHDDMAPGSRYPPSWASNDQAAWPLTGSMHGSVKWTHGTLLPYNLSFHESGSGIIVALGGIGDLLHKQPEPDTLSPSLIQPTALQEPYYSQLQG